MRSKVLLTHIGNRERQDKQKKNKKKTKQMGLDTTKPIFGVSDSDIQTSLHKIEMSLVGSFHTELSKKTNKNALNRLRGCTGWSVPVLFAKPQRQVFSHRGPN